MANTALNSFYKVEIVDGILTSKLSKRVSVNEFRSMLLELREIALEKHINRLLVDGYSVDFNDMTIAERHDIGLMTAEILKGDFRGVMVIKREYINKHGENVANNRGADVLVTDEMDEARKFLLR